MSNTLIIAEIGVNHSGRLDHAIQLIHAAKDAGADACKFQLFDPELLAPGNFEQRAMLKAHALTRNEILMCAAETHRYEMEFMCTAFDAVSLGWLAHHPTINLKRVKIGSGQMFNTAPNQDLWQMTALTKLPVILSNGMAEDGCIDAALHFLGTEPKTLMYCISKYPTPETRPTMSELSRLRSKYQDMSIGFSSHCRSFWPSVAAVYAGATVVEAHLALPGCTSPDATSSLLLEEFKAMVREIRVADNRA